MTPWMLPISKIDESIRNIVACAISGAAYTNGNTGIFLPDWSPKVTIDSDLITKILSLTRAPPATRAIHRPGRFKMNQKGGDRSSELLMDGDVAEDGEIEIDDENQASRATHLTDDEISTEQESENEDDAEAKQPKKRFGKKRGALSIHRRIGGPHRAIAVRMFGILLKECSRR